MSRQRDLLFIGMSLRQWYGEGQRGGGGGKEEDAAWWLEGMCACESECGGDRLGWDAPSVICSVCTVGVM